MVRLTDMEGALPFGTATNNRQRWQAPDVPAELAKRAICKCILEICFLRDVMRLKDKKISWSLLARHLYTGQLACEPQTESLAHFSVAVRNGRKKRPVLSIEVLHPEARRLLLLLYLCGRTNSAKSSW